MSKQLRSRLWFAVALVLAIACMSCGVKKGDSPFDPANLGSVAVVVSPADLGAPWTMDGPLGLHRTGSGTTTVGSLAAGTYTITWGARGGWETPVPSTGDLAASGTLTLTGTYVALAPGTIEINCSPAECSAPWRLEWNGGADFLTGAGTTAMSGRLAGDYVIRWQAADGWRSPTPAWQAFTLVAGGLATVAAQWVQLPPGTVQIDPNPDSVNAPWTLLGPAGYQTTGTGDSAVSSLPGGSYSVQWGTVSGWTSPSPALATGTLAANGLLVFHGTYLEVPPVTISVDVTPNTITAPWTVTGPSGFSLTQAGDWSQGGLPAGQYSITWGDAGPSWRTPSPATVSYSVVAGASRTFTGTYAAILPVTIGVNVTPDNITAQWQLTGPNGFLVNHTGDWSQSGLVNGEYAIQWGSAGSDWISPSPISSSAVVAEGGSHTFSGVYAAPVKIGIFTTSDGVSLNSHAHWNGAYGINAYILILNPDASGVSYWHAAIATDGLTMIAYDTLVAGTWPVPRPTGVFQLQISQPLLPNGSGAVYVASIHVSHFGEGFTRDSPLYWTTWEDVPLPMYSTGNNVDTRISLTPSSGSWATPALIISP